MPSQAPSDVSLYLGALAVTLATAALYLLSCIRAVAEYERCIVVRLRGGRRIPTAPGLRFVFWPFERLERVDVGTMGTAANRDGDRAR